MPVRATALLPVLLVLGVLVGTSAGAELQNGVYEGLVVGVRQGTPEPADGNAFVEEVTSFLNAGSEALNHALDGRASFGAVRLIIPRDWDKNKFTSVLPPPAQFNFRDSVDILLHDDPNTLPDTLQSEQCGVPGRRIEVPISFLTLTAEEEVKYGTTGHILTHEWSHYRWGAHDEHGNRMDPVYDGAYQVEGNALVTSCYAGQLLGAWKSDCSSTAICNPASPSDKTKPCYFCIDDGATPTTTQASLGYLPALSTGKFCDALTHNSLSPSPHNILCGGRSITELINAHPDSQSLAVHSPGTVTVTVHEEPLGLVVIALDTPPAAGGEVLSYGELLTALQGPLTGTHARQHVSVLSYRALEDVVDFYNEALFSPITTERYGELRALLPSAEPRDTPPDLSSVFQYVLETFGTTNYTYDGVLLVLPVTDDLLAASKLDAALGESLRTARIKPLLLFPETAPALASVAPFLQEAGARFLYRNASTGPVDYAATAAGDEVAAFVTRPFMNDHPILYHDSVELAQGKSYNHTVFYQGIVSEHLMALITTTGLVSDLSVSHMHLGEFADCLGKSCTALPDSVVYIKKNKKRNVPGEEWALLVANNGPDATVDVKWTAVNFVGEDEELDVVVWWSDGRGPVADIDQNGRLVLYASITNRGYLVPSSEVTVLADVEVTPPGGPAQTLTGLVLEDDGEGVDIRSQDGVYSYGFPEQVFAEGTDATVLVLRVVDIPFATQGAASARASSSAGAQARRPQSSGLFPLDPLESECCGSYVQNPNIEMNYHIKGYNLVSKRTFETVTLTRTIGGRAEVTTTPAGTTASTTVAAGTTASTTVAAGTTASTTVAAGTTASTTTAAAGTTATTTVAAGTTASTTAAAGTEPAQTTITEPPTEDPAIKEVRQLSIAAISLASVAIAVQVACVIAFLLFRGRAGV